MEHLAAVGRHLHGPFLAREVDEPFGDLTRELEALRVDVDEGENSVVQALDGKGVRDDLACEHRAAGPDHRHLRHRAGILNRVECWSPRDLPA